MYHNGVFYSYFINTVRNIEAVVPILKWRWWLNCDAIVSIHILRRLTNTFVTSFSPYVPYSCWQKISRKHACRRGIYVPKRMLQLDAWWLLPRKSRDTSGSIKRGRNSIYNLPWWGFWRRRQARTWSWSEEETTCRRIYWRRVCRRWRCEQRS